MAQDVVRRVVPLGFPWQTLDPFLACMHHVDAYPAGDVNVIALSAGTGVAVFC